MKKIISLICVVIFAFSCNSYKSEIESPNVASTAINIDKLAGSKIGKSIDGKFQFTASTSSIFKTFKDLVEIQDEIILEPHSLKVITLDSKKYLRFYSQDNYVSTIELIVDKNNNYVAQSTVCTSSASVSGCVPDGLYCTKCKTGDCKRITTS